jgi:hypothetical protein
MDAEVRPEVTNLGIHPTGTYRTMGAKQRGWLRYPAFWVGVLTVVERGIF